MPLLVVELAAAEDARVFGGKAHGLARLIAAGARVPPGLAVAATTLPFDAWPDEERETVRLRVAGLLAGGPLAVRSSAIGEDGSERSFAGMFESVLGLGDAASALEAMERCLSSGGSERARAYLGAEAAIAIGLVIQRMVAARAAGVCFTVDPAGQDHAIVIEAVAGTGDALVSGRSAPDRWRVYRNGLGRFEAQRDARSGAAVLVADEAIAIAVEALALAARFGHPLDLEWAKDAAGVAWLQARPVTAARKLHEWVFDRYHAGVDDGPVTVWANFNVRETMPDPFTPLNASVWREIVLPIVMDDLFAVPRGSRFHAHLTGIDYVHGRIYWNMNALMTGVMGAVFGWTLRHIDARAADVVARLRAEGILTQRKLRDGRGFSSLALAHAGVRIAARLLRALRPRRGLAELNECGRRIGGRPDVGLFGDAELIEEMLLLGSPECEGIRWANQMLATAMLIWGLADRAFGPHPEARRLLTAGIRGNPTTQISLGVDRLAAAARPLAAAFREPLPAAERLRLVAAAPGGQGWLEELRAFLARFGQRCPKEFDIGAPRWTEDPTMILDLVRAGLASPASESVDQRLERLAEERSRAVAAAAAAAPFWQRPPLRALARLVELYMPLREAPKHNAMFVFQRMRQAAQELGARLVARGTLDTRADVFFLEWSELQGLFTEPPREIPELAALIGQRRARLARFEREKPPDFVRSDGVPVPEPWDEPAADGPLMGVGASSGSAEGPVRILRTPDPGAMSQGDVIVVEFADPGWTPLFPRAAAIVMEVGGLMCHAAVVARELGIPAAFGVREATSRLRDGERVRVDGTSGTITRL